MSTGIGKVSDKLQHHAKQMEPSMKSSSLDQQSSRSESDLVRRRLNMEDDSEIKAMAREYLTLEETKEARHFNGLRKKHSGLNQKNILFRMEKYLMKKLFESNNVMLDHQAINMPLYHVILFLEFIQLLFFIFYKVIIKNEFNSSSMKSQSNEQHQIQQDLYSNQLLSQLKQFSFQIKCSFSGDISIILEQSGNNGSFNIDSVFSFINFHVYALSNSQTFLLAFFIFSGTFAALLAFHFIVVGKLFYEDKRESLKESSKFQIKAASILMQLFLTLLQIPFTCIIMQGFKCEESLFVEYAISDLDCSSMTHGILLILSPIVLTMYYGFLVIQLQLYTSRSFYSDIPWRQFDRKLPLLKVAIRLILVCSFIFDKAGSTMAYMNICCFAVNGYIVYKRFKDCLIFTKSVHFAVLFYEVVATCLFIQVPALVISGSLLSIGTLIGIFIVGITMAGIFIMQQDINQVRIVVDRKVSQQIDCELHSYLLHEIIANNSYQDLIIGQGVLNYHIEVCTDDKCKCIFLIEALSGLKKYKERKKEDEVEDKDEMQSEEQFSRMQSDTHSTKSESPSPRKKISLLNVIASFKQLAVLAFLPKKATPQGGPPLMRKNTFLVQALNDYKEQEMAELEASEQFNPINKEKMQKKLFKYLSFEIIQSIKRFPANIQLRLINTQIQKSRLKNPFKAIFELINCDLLDTTMQEKFAIFRKKLEIEQDLIVMYSKTSQARSGYIDILKIYEYEKLYQRFCMHEFLATHSSIQFWKELLQKTFKAQTLQTKGMEISRYYQKMQDVAAELQLLFPEDIKFLFRYGMFLVNIINNEFDGHECFMRAQQVYQGKIYKKGQGGGGNNTGTVNKKTELQQFGENSASGMIVISATSTSCGNVIHSNEQLEYVLGYQKRELLGKNVSVIMPSIIGQHHNRFIVRYLDTAKCVAIDNMRQHFAITKAGYIREIELLIKVFPHVDNRIIFVGFLQKTEVFDKIEPPQSEYENQEFHYIITDSKGYIANITEGLTLELGLHPKFFTYSEHVHTMIHITSICRTIRDWEQEVGMELEGGSIQTFDTTQILEQVELEKLSSEELLEIRANVCRQQVLVQLKKLVLDKSFCTIHVYRLIIVNNNAMSLFLNEQSGNASKLLKRPSKESSYNNEGRAIGVGGSFEENNDPMNDDGICMQSVASSSGGSVQSFANIIQNFKKTLVSKTTPKNLLYLNRLIIVILLTTILLQAIDFSKIQNQTTNLSSEQKHNLNSEKRTSGIVQLASNVRTLINVANEIEFEDYEIEALNKYDDRFEFVERLIQKQANDLQMIHTFLSQQRNTQDAGSNDEQSIYEYEPVELFRLDDKNKVSIYHQPYRTGFFTYVSNILLLNNTKEINLKLSDSLMIQSPCGNLTTERMNTTMLQRGVYFLMTNGLRSLRVKSYQSTLFQQQNSFNAISIQPFLIIMIIGISLQLLSIVVVQFRIWDIEKIQEEILIIFAHLPIPNVQLVHSKCSSYLEQLTGGSFLEFIEYRQNHDDIDQAYQDSANAKFNPASTLLHIGGTFNADHATFKGFGRMPSFKAHDVDNGEYSEEEKEEHVQRTYIEIRRRQKLVGSGVFQKHPDRHASLGQDMFTAILNRMYHESPEAQEEMEYLRKAQEALMAASKQERSKDSFTKDDESSFFKQQQKQEKERQLKLKEERLRASYQRSSQAQSSSIIGQEEVEKPKLKRSQNIKKLRMSKRFGLKSKQKNGSQQPMQLEALQPQEPHIERNSKQSNEESNEVDVTNNNNLSFVTNAPIHEELPQKTEKQEKRDKEKEVLDETKERVKQIKKTMKVQNISTKIGSSLIALVLSSYFIMLYLLHDEYIAQLHLVQSSIPIFLNRYRFLSLSQSLLRERIIYNNSLQSFEIESSGQNYGHDIDTFYYELSMRNEQTLTQLKTNYPSILSEMIDFSKSIDSDNFCPGIFGNTITEDQQYPEQYKDGLYLKGVQINSYQLQIKTVITACKSAYRGDIEALQELRRLNIDFNQGDYDMRTPLHFAVRENQLKAVQFLVDSGVKVNSVDRWEATPLNYALPNSAIESLLKQRGGYYGKTVLMKQIHIQANLTDNEVRLYYAAFYGDIKSAEILRQLGNKLNTLDIDGRTPLHIAASQGQLQFAQYLISKGCDPTVVDLRDNGAVNDAEREGFPFVHDFLDGIITNSIIQKSCHLFSHGLFAQGFHIAISTFNKKFKDLQLKVNQISHSEMMSLLGGRKYSKIAATSEEESNHSLLQTYFQSQEIFISRIIDALLTKIDTTFADYSSKYSQQTDIIFVAYLVAVLFILLVIRSRIMQRMTSDIFESRGILNLLPNSFFVENKSMVEGLMKKLKD